MESTEESVNVNSAQLFAYILILFTIFMITKRFNWEEMFQQNLSPVHHVKSTQEICFQEVFNPFHVALSNQNRSSITEGLYLELTLLKPSFVRLFWGADIEAFYKEIQQSWDVLSKRIQEGTFLGLKKTEVTSYTEKSQVCENSLWHVTVAEKITQDSETPPRKTYPVVVACTLDESPSDDKQIVIMLTVLHIRDQQLPLDSQILFQFLITNENKISTLQPFYVSTDNSGGEVDGRRYYSHSRPQQLNHGSATVSVADRAGIATTSDESDTTERDINSGKSDTTVENDDNGNSDATITAYNSGRIDAGAVGDTGLFSEGSFGEPTNGHVDVDHCCVCQDAEMTIVLLPCRHGCVCNQCVLKLDKCPVCRDIFSSYFRIKEHTSSSSNSTSERRVENVSNHVVADNWWERLNDRLNTFFGFT